MDCGFRRYIRCNQKIDNAAKVMNMLSSRSEFYLIPGAFTCDISNYFQAQFVASNIFYELFCFVISGKLQEIEDDKAESQSSSSSLSSSSKWICKIEFRSSSATSLLVFDTNFEKWILQISNNLFAMLNGIFFDFLSYLMSFINVKYNNNYCFQFKKLRRKTYSH